MHRDQLKRAIATSPDFSYENEIALPNVKSEDIRDILIPRVYFRLIKKQPPESFSVALNDMTNDGLLKQNGRNKPWSNIV